MSASLRLILTIAAALGAVVSAGYYIRTDLSQPEKLVAPIYVNVEIEPAAAANLFVVFTTAADSPQVMSLAPTTPASGARTVVQGAVIYPTYIDGSTDAKRAEGKKLALVNALYLATPKGQETATLDAIRGGGVSIFIGRNLYYVSPTELAALPRADTEKLALFKLPLAPAPSLFHSAVNWLGDGNYLLKLIADFCWRPESYGFTWWYFLGLLLLQWRRIGATLNSPRFHHAAAKFAFIALIGVGLAWRCNGLLRGGAWFDELFSAVAAGNPNLPWASIFSDSGNPPFYFLLLKCWLAIFGWTETAGRWSSALFGVAAVAAVYWLVKIYAGRRAAWFAGAMLAISDFAIGLSHEMRVYVVDLALAPLFAIVFLHFLRRADTRSLIIYVGLGVMLANAHFYGAFLIIANFLFYLLYQRLAKKWSWRAVGVFFGANVVIGLSLLPYFLHIILNGTISRNYIHSFYGAGRPVIPPQYIWQMLATPLIVGVYVVLRQILATRFAITRSQKLLLDYAIAVQALIFTGAFGLALFHPHLTARYFSIYFPFTLITPILVGKILWQNWRAPIIWRNFNGKTAAKLLLTRVVPIVLVYGALRWSADYNGGSGNTDYYQSASEFMIRDAAAHPQISASIDRSVWWRESLQLSAIDDFYRLKNPLPVYAPDSLTAVVYVNPIEERFFKQLPSAPSLANRHLLKICITNNRYIYKFYRQETAPVSEPAIDLPPPAENAAAEVEAKDK